MKVKLEDVQVLTNRASYWMNKGYKTFEALIKAEIDLEGDFNE